MINLFNILLSFGLAQYTLAIHGGSFAQPGEFPFLVQIYYQGTFVCGGSIISPFLVLTAAHCFSRRKYIQDFHMIGGSHKLKNFHFDRLSNLKSILQLRTIQEYFPHPDFNLTGQRENDISLVYLSSPFHFTDKLGQISLPEENESFPDEATVLGWGYTNGNATESSTHLKKANLPLGDSKKCKDFVKDLGDKNWSLNDNQICIRISSSETGSTCKGDSGGPLICQTGSKTLNETLQTTSLCGIISWGDSDATGQCGTSNFNIFTDVFKYKDWILATIANIDSRTRCSQNHFFCHSNRTCIPRSYLCNGQADCGLREDETNCENYEKCMKVDNFRCNNGKCIGFEDVCDVTNDCKDMPGTSTSSDEEKCPKMKNESCLDGLHECGVNDRCIPNEWKHDGIPDCLNLSDEQSLEVNNFQNDLSSKGNCNKPTQKLMTMSSLSLIIFIF